MEKSSSDLLVIVLAAAFWAFMLLTPLGGVILRLMLSFYSSWV